MKKLKSNVEFKEVRYLDSAIDLMWSYEAEKLLPWCYGKGADIGCGQRSIKEGIIRVDLDPNHKPDICCSGDDLPFKDGELDFITSIHSFEHFSDQKKLLIEWLRVLKSGGIVGIVHPDIGFTKKQNPIVDNPGLKENPFNRHYHENDLKSFREQLLSWADLPFKIVDSGVACEGWSFFVILTRT